MPKILAGKTEIECRLIIFDRNGTLVDQQHFLLNLAKARFQSLSKIAGVHVAKLWEKAVGTDLKHGCVDHNGPLATAPQREELLVAASVIYQCGHSWSEAKKIAQEAYDQADESLKPTYGCVLFEGVSDILRELKSNGVKLAIATTDSHKRTEESLNSLGVAQFFDAIIGADDVENSKPAPDMVLEACRQTGCRPGDAVVVGDSSSDMMMGKNAKVKKCIAVLTGFTPKEKLQKIADVVIESVNEIKSKNDP
ncbi:MAG: HAD family hydrolase [Candidatus Bathyarchaeota archaeon]|jgi:phosphoglycolate phosphatase|nr:HAD family hydrolase [Candidatus Bathyarchaeota archaeon]